MKNIVICCDGTGNRFSDRNSNVVKLYACLAVNQDQVAYYHPGLGTMGNPNNVTWPGRQATKIAGLAFGYGLRDHLAEAYRFLMETYAEGDHIFLFGFSRGAYTVRALAGALSMYGLLCPGNEGHLPYLLHMYSQESRRAYKSESHRGRRLQETPISAAFRETFARQIPIHFIGVWDTVSSVGWIYDPVKLLYDGQNPIMRKGRHAVSLDERRCFFQSNLWGPPLDPAETPVLASHYDGQDQQQDIVQAWFPGVHSDVGGSYAQQECSPALNALKWLLDEAEQDGLRVNTQKKNIIFGIPDTSAHQQYPELGKINVIPPPGQKLHNSMTFLWRLCELFPHKYFDGAGRLRWQAAPTSHPREVPEDSLLHPSLIDRLSSDPRYRPGNLDLHLVLPLHPAVMPALHPRAQASLLAQHFSIYHPRKSSAEALPPRTPVEEHQAVQTH